ncbi:tautomerase family protein [Rhizobium tropici]|uniref:Tautomerase family protein n=1 Tax=Rhizobium tropici TaxID=398 RepID=A0A5B0W9E0_RHITR|nr:tautomerase family protein [Rhizobium tropici]KAA1183068.1 tautomerase family protein [Rhizobium tropici]
MPLLNIHTVKGRSEEQTSALLQAIHDAMVEAFEVPVRDRYQILHEHEPKHLIMEDTGLGFERTAGRVLIHVTTRPRTKVMKERFYALLVEYLGKRCNVHPQDIMVSCIQNNDDDWSFGFGRAQFLTGEL